MELKPIYTMKESGKTYMLAVLFNLAVQFISIFALTFLGVIDTENTDIGTIPQLVIMLFIQVAMFGALSINGKQKLLKAKDNFKLNHKTIALCVLASIIMLIGFMSLNMYFSLFLYEVGYKDSAELIFDNWASIVLGFFVICLVAPIVEESVYRYGVLQGLKGNGSKRALLKAALLSGLFFALMHVNPMQTFYQFIIGFVAALFVIKTGSLLAGILIHFVNNFITFIIGFFPTVDHALGDYFSSWVSVPISIVLLALASFAIFYILKFIKPRDKNDDKNTDNCTVGTQGSDDNSATPRDVFNPNHNTSSTDTTTSYIYFGIAIGICVFLWGFQLISGL